VLGRESNASTDELYEGANIVIDSGLSHSGCSISSYDNSVI